MSFVVLGINHRTAPVEIREKVVFADADLAEALGAPINIVGRRGMPDVAQLERMGIARISTASGPSLVVMSAMRQIADELSKGRFDVLDSVITRADAQAMFAARSIDAERTA